MITSGGKRKPAKPDLDADTRARQRRISPACPLAVMRPCNSALWCARCQRRLILRPSTSKTGNIYFYYICRGVQERDCDLPALPVAKVEHAVTNHYTNVAIPAQHRTRLETLATQACTDSHQTLTKLLDRLRQQLTELDRQEDRYLDLLGDPDWPQAKLKSRLRDIRDSKLRITQQLEQTTDHLDSGRTVLTTALELLDRPRDLYNTATDHARKLLNKAIFTRLYLNIDVPEHGPAVITDDLNEPFASLVHTARTKNLTQPTQNAPHDRLSSLLATALAGQSASKAAMVEVPGIEPGSSVASSGLLRAQSAMPLLGSTGLAN
jgi:site-specific DNA recombinase